MIESGVKMRSKLSFGMAVALFVGVTFLIVGTAFLIEKLYALPTNYSSADASPIQFQAYEGGEFKIVGSGKMFLRNDGTIDFVRQNGAHVVSGTTSRFGCDVDPNDYCNNIGPITTANESWTVANLYGVSVEITATSPDLMVIVPRTPKQIGGVNLQVEILAVLLWLVSIVCIVAVKTDSL